MSTIVNEQYIEFGLSQEKYSIRIQDIHEIIKMQDITETPNSPHYVKGVINLRGKIVPVISLRAMFDIPEEPYTKATRIIVVNHVDETVGVIVDKVDKVTTFTDIQPPPERIGAIDGNYLVGIGINDDQLVGILKLDQVLLK